MLSQPSRLFIPIALVTMVLAGAYGAFTGDVLGVVLFLTVALVAGFMAVPVGGLGAQPALAEVGGPNGEDPALQPGGGVWPMLAAVAVALTVMGLVVGPLAAYAGLVVLAVAGVGWTARLGVERTGRTVNLEPIGMPVIGLAAIASLMFFMSRMLLAVSETGSWVVALLVGAAIVAVAGLVSVRPQMSTASMAAVLVVGSTLMVGGGLVAAAKGERPIEAHGAEGEDAEGGHSGAEENSPATEGDEKGHEDEGGKGGDEEGVGESHDAESGKPSEPGSAPPAEAVAIRAELVAFDSKVLDFKAEAPAVIAFDNADSGVVHNVAIYETKEATSDEAIFVGKLLTGPAQITYEFVAPKAGTYYFRCDVHPYMAGEVTVQ